MDFLKHIEIQDIKEIIHTDYIENKIHLLLFYDFLAIKEGNLSTICKIVGSLLEYSEEVFDVPHFILYKIVMHYPSLYYDKRYSGYDIDGKFKKLESEKLKHISPIYFYRFDIQNNLIDYCGAGNFEMVKYLSKIITTITQKDLQYANGFLGSMRYDLNLDNKYSFPNNTCYNIRNEDNITKNVPNSMALLINRRNKSLYYYYALRITWSKGFENISQYLEKC